MKAGQLKFDLVDAYLKLLNSLGAESKRELISKLSDSLKGSNKNNSSSFKKLFGAFESERSAEQIISDLKGSRNFTRNICGL